jgi:hypothetical protein
VATPDPAAVADALDRLSQRCSCLLLSPVPAPHLAGDLAALLGLLDCTANYLRDPALATLLTNGPGPGVPDPTPVPSASAEAPVSAADRDFADLQQIACGPLLRDQQSRLFALLAQTNWTASEIAAWLRATYEVGKIYSLNAAQADRAIADLEAQFAATATA